MAATPAPNARASLLAGLRTGGVRSASGPIPHTAAPAGTFNIPRIIATSNDESVAVFPPEEDEEDELSNMAQNLYVQQSRSHQGPVTAAVDGLPNRFMHQQQYQQQQQQQTIAMNNNNNMMMSSAMAQNQLQQVQLQLMQLEIARLQNIQAQQYQAELLAQRQRQGAQQGRRAASYAVPSTAGPMNTSFDLRAMNPQIRRSNQADVLRSKLGITEEQQVPMTAALGGKFGSRIGSGKYDSDEDDFSSTGAKPPSTPGFTTVISGGTLLGNANAPATPAAPSKSDTAVSWRRGPTNNSVLNGNRAASSPMVKITPPPTERVSPPPGVKPPSPTATAAKSRPMPLRFVVDNSQPAVAVDGIDADDSSSSSSKSSPTTPHSAASGELSPREEATKKLYEGLGIAPGINVVVPQDSGVIVQRVTSLPVRQPKGPPSNNDELIPKNFATRSRRRALGALVDAARERAQVVEAY